MMKQVSRLEGLPMANFSNFRWMYTLSLLQGWNM